MEETKSKKRKRRPTYYYRGRPLANFYDRTMSCSYYLDKFLEKSRELVFMCEDYGELSLYDHKWEEGTLEYDLHKFFVQYDEESFAYWSFLEQTNLSEYEIKDCRFKIADEKMIIDAPEVIVVIEPWGYLDESEFNGILYFKNKDGEAYYFDELDPADAETVSLDSGDSCPAIFMTKEQIRKNQKIVDDIQDQLDKIYAKHKKK